MHTQNTHTKTLLSLPPCFCPACSHGSAECEADLKALTNGKVASEDKNQRQITPQQSQGFPLNPFYGEGSGRTVKNIYTLHPVRALLAYLE